MLWKNKTKSIYKVPNLKQTKEQNSVYSITSLNNTRRLNLNLCADIRNESERTKRDEKCKIWTQKNPRRNFFLEIDLFSSHEGALGYNIYPTAKQVRSIYPPPSRCNFIENPANRNAPAWWTETKDMDVFMYIDDYLWSSHYFFIFKMLMTSHYSHISVCIY